MLCELARRMESVMRRYDSVGRFGGEEFLVIVAGCHAVELGELLERLRDVVAGSPFTAEGTARGHRQPRRRGACR